MLVSVLISAPNGLVRVQLRDTAAPSSSWAYSDVRDLARATLIDTIVPYRWSDTVLTAYVMAGIQDLLNRRPMAAYGSSVSANFMDALSRFVVSRALSQDAEDKGNLARSEALFQEYLALIAAWPGRWSDATLMGYLSIGVREIVKRHHNALCIDPAATSVPAITVDEIGDVTDPTQAIPITDRWANALVCFTVGRALQEEPDNKQNLARADRYMAQFASYL